MKLETIVLRGQSKIAANEPSADNAGGFRRLAFTEPANDIDKQKEEQVNPALRLPAGRWGQYKLKLKL